jgi:hypothetical protein
MLFGNLTGFAAYRWSIATHTDLSWNVDEGRIWIDVKYFDDHGSDIVDYNSGLAPNDGWMNLSFGDTELRITCNSQGSGLSVTRNKGSETYSYVDLEYTSKDMKTVRIYWNVKQTHLNIPQTISFNGKWWHRGATSDDKISATSSITPSWERGTFSVNSPVVVSNYSDNGNLPVIKIPWTKTNIGNVNSSGDITLCDENGNPVSIEGTLSLGGGNSCGTFILNAAGNNSLNLNQSHTFIIKQTYTPTANSAINYTTTSERITVRAYPQVINFEPEFNSTNRTIQLKWDIENAPAANYIDDKFRIDVTKTLGGNTTTSYHEISYTGGTTNYSQSITVEEGAEATYSFQLYRTTTKDSASWKANYTQAINNYTVNTIHARPTNAQVTLSSDKRTGTVSWDISGNVWSSGSRFIISRINVTSGASEDITLSKSDFEKEAYIDDLIRICNEYKYKLFIIPNESYGSVAPIYTESIIPTEIGSIKNISASKGYYSDRVQINWDIEGVFDEFTIKRKPYDSPDTEYRQIGTINGSSVQNTYLFTDETGQAGIVYAYQVSGLVNCAGGIITSVEKPSDTGFRTPTGDIYGRVTFENGQAVENVELNVVSEENIRAKSLAFTSGATASVSNTDLLKNNTGAVTLQAWIAPDVTAGLQKVISKDGMYELGVEDNKFYFKAGNTTVKTDTLSVSSVVGDFKHLTGVYDNDSLLIYINGDLIAQTITSVSPTVNDKPVEIGGGVFAGIIDEVRIWGSALSDEEIKRDYNRYITGGESNLLAYYTFNYAVETEFYDISFAGTLYNENHGTLSATGVSISDNIPPIDQLGYRGVTAADGSYSVRSIPYQGNGTAYRIIPKLGIHSFESEQEVRFIGSGAQSHTVNFIDKSSFTVTGWVTYENSTIPVQGVNFNVDGKMVLKSTGIPEETDAQGRFEIRVPVGTHEVKATKANHTFVNDGRITNQYGLDLNYQDEVLGLELEDNTTIKYIGRVAGGAVQEAFPIGHSLSTNNLAEGITVTLTYPNEAYKFDARTVTETHFKPSNKNKAHVNQVEYGTDPNHTNAIIIQVNDTTGEFVAHVIPEQFMVTANAGAHHTNIPGSGSMVNFSNQFNLRNEVYEYTDSVQVDNNLWNKINYSDTVYYQASQKFIKRYTPEIRMTQVDPQLRSLPFFGDTITTSSTLIETVNVPLYDKESNTYTFGKPVFSQHGRYTLKAEIFEVYTHYNSNGDATVTDEVVTQDASIIFNNDIAISADQAKVVEANEKGIAIYTFCATDPELTSAIQRIEASVTYGSEDNPTSIPWEYPLSFPNGEAFVLGAHQTGVNFVTQGPDKVLTVLRDPPGSNSYSYLEKGLTISNTSTSTLSNIQSGEEDLTVGMKQATITFAGVGAGTISKITEAENKFAIGITHEEEWQSTDSKTETTTTITRFQTSDDPLYVGANGDLYVGYSTNVSFGTTENVTAIPKVKYDSAPDSYEKVYANSNDWVLVKNTGMSISQSFNTLFAYPQIHIEEVLIPQMKTIRNSLLLQPGEYTETELQAAANRDKRPYYISYFIPNSEHFGKSNEDKTLSAFDKVNGTPDNKYDGPSYKIIKPEEEVFADTITAINQSIQRWIKQLENNEKAKQESVLLQNYSFNAGSNIEYSESYSTLETGEDSFSWILGGSITTDFDFTIFGVKNAINISESYSHVTNKTTVTEEEAAHTKGFVLAEDGTDYISVDVCREKSWSKEDEEYDNIEEKDYYSSFIFKTKAGATSCPYEGAYVTKYFEPGVHTLDVATMQVEVPEIDMPMKFIENVPSGETAKLQLYLRNNSETKDDNWFDLKVLDGSNPDGARFSIDGTGIGNGRAFLVPAGETLVKTLEVGKGAALNYDGLQLILQSQCQYDPTDFLEDIGDTVTFTVHFIPSCTDVNIKKPTSNWTYNTRLPLTKVNGIDKHYMEVLIDGFNVNYDNFGRIEFQYKSASQSDDEWTTLMNYYNDSTLYNAAIENGLNAEMILAAYAGTIPYRFIMDDLPDQRYDLRAVSVCIINNEEVRNESEIRSGIKDMYLPRLFGSPQPADGILNVEDDVRLNFNEAIAEGLLTRNNFTVQGVRNGSITDHSTSIELDGENDYLATEFEKSLEGKDVTVEMWIQPAEAQKAQNATLFSHGNINESLELAITSDNKLQVTVGSTTLTSSSPVAYESGSWAHVALVYEAEGYLTAYYNYTPAINRTQTATYNSIGNILIGKSIKTGGNPYGGKIHNVRIWEKPVSSADLQTNSLAQLSGIETALVGYYPMNEGKGTLAGDKARGATLLMNGGKWALPDGFAVTTDGNAYLQIDASSAAITKEMDFTIEFWFKAESGQTDATLLSNGRGDGNDLGGSDYLFNIGFDETGALTFTNNGVKTTVEGDYRDNNWHHFALGVDRAIGRGQIYMDGRLNTYIDGANIGGVSSPYLYLGARGWYHPDNATSLIADNHFKGQFDDLRFWQLYKNERLVSENSHVKLSGNELGLLHYYPFDTYIEWQGGIYVEFTNKDMHIASGVNPETDQFTVIGASTTDVQTKDIAPLKDAGPLADLEFDFVVNNDALIINLKEQEYKVAKTIVTFTVEDVRDVNGNSIASPITWSAYIDRNQLKWSEDRLNLTQQVYDGLEFTVRAVNSGGSVQRYTIDNIPAWLDVTPPEGTINPSSYEEITFSVNEGLNVGAYDEVVYLVNEDGVAEPLALNIVVKGEEPDWNVNPADYEYSMSVIGKLRFNNLFSNDKNDKIAAFSDGVCVGVANSSYNKPLDMWYALLTIYSNSATNNNKPLEFRMWDAGTGKTYKANPSQTIRFVNNGIVGDAEEPVIFDGQEIFYNSIELNSGWNWISFNLYSDELKDLNRTLADGVWTGNDQVKTLNTFDAYSAQSRTWSGSLSKNGGLNNTSLFLLRSTDAQSLSVSGMAVDVRTTPISVKGGQWNYISYLPSVNTTVKEGLAGYDARKGDIIKSQNAFAIYSQNEWIGDLAYMEANKGYMLYRTATDNVDFYYPSTGGSLGNLRIAAIGNEKAYINRRFAENMSLIATSPDLQPGDSILAYINGELRGIGNYRSGTTVPLSFMTIVGEENGTYIRFELQRDGKTAGYADNGLSFTVDGVKGTPNEPIVLRFISADTDGIYPNPFVRTFTVNVPATAQGEQVEIKLTDLLGRIRLLQTKRATSEGINAFLIDASGLEAGVYVVKVTTGSYSKAQVIEKLK